MNNFHIQYIYYINDVIDVIDTYKFQLEYNRCIYSALNVKQ